MSFVILLFVRVGVLFHLLFPLSFVIFLFVSPTYYYYYKFFIITLFPLFISIIIIVIHYYINFFLIIIIINFIISFIIIIIITVIIIITSYYYYYIILYYLLFVFYHYSALLPSPVEQATILAVKLALPCIFVADLLPRSDNRGWGGYKLKLCYAPMLSCSVSWCC